MIKSVLITGANSGLGKEAARQFALLDGAEKVYLGCRNKAKAEAAKQSLEESTGKSIFEIVLIDVSDVASVRAAVASLDDPIEGLVMNAGGIGGATPGAKTSAGVTHIFAANVLGHAVLLEELLKQKKLTKVAVYVSTEAARGVAKMGMKQPNLNTSSVDEFASIADGAFFGSNLTGMEAYGPVKYMGTMWMSSLARKYPDLRLLTVSPGGTDGTAAMNDLPPMMRFMYKNLGTRIMPLMGMMHKLEVGAKRYVDVLNDDSYKSGMFYASKEPVLTGPLIDQSTIFGDLNNEAFQDNAYEAIHSYIN